MKITKQELIELEACSSGLDRFIAQTNNTDEPVEVSSLVGGKNSYDDLLWLAGKKLPKEPIVRFACDCALLNIELIKPYTDEFDGIVEFLRNPTHFDAARAASDAAADATDAADVIDDAAALVADAASYAADTARVADAYWYTAARAAIDVARVADSDNEAKINELLRELFA